MKRRERPRLLFLCQTLPFPPDSGVHARSYNILKVLSSGFDVTSLFFYRRVSRPRTEDVSRALAGLSPLADAEAFSIPQEHSRTRLVWDHARSILGARPYTRYAYESRAFRSRLSTILAFGNFDLVHFDSLDLSAYLGLVTRAPIACTHHNVESQLLERMASATSNPLLSRYLTHQAQLMEDEERRWCPRVDLNVTVSDEDCKSLQRLAPEGRFTVVPNGVDTERFRPASGEQNGVVFVGGYDWFPNRDAMEYFGEAILGRFRELCPETPVRWVGRVPEPAAEHFRRVYGIQTTGFVEDVRVPIAGAVCYIAPLRVGGGTRLKLLEGMAMGKAIVSTPQGCEGLQIQNGVNMLVSDNPRRFAEAMASIVRDPNLRDRLGVAARNAAVEQYDWRVVGSGLIRTYREIIDGRATSAARRPIA